MKLWILAVFASAAYINLNLCKESSEPEYYFLNKEDFEVHYDALSFDDAYRRCFNSGKSLLSIESYKVFEALLPRSVRNKFQAEHTRTNFNEEFWVLEKQSSSLNKINSVSNNVLKCFHAVRSPSSLEWVLKQESNCLKPRPFVCVDNKNNSRCSETGTLVEYLDSRSLSAEQQELDFDGANKFCSGIEFSLDYHKHVHNIGLNKDARYWRNLDKSILDQKTYLSRIISSFIPSFMTTANANCRVQLDSSNLSEKSSCAEKNSFVCSRSVETKLCKGQGLASDVEIQYKLPLSSSSGQFNSRGLQSCVPEVNHFNLQEIALNNLGGFCGFEQGQTDLCQHGQQVIQFSNVTQVNGIPVFLTVSNLSDYSPFNAQKNGIMGEFGQINMAANSNTSFEFYFHDENGMAVYLDHIPFTIYDLDNGGCDCELPLCSSCTTCNSPAHSREVFTVLSTEVINWDLDVDSSLCVDQTASSVSFSSTEEGTFADNPTSPSALTEFQRKVSVTVEYTQRSSFVVNFRSIGGLSGRNFLYTFFNYTECLTDTPTSQPTVTISPPAPAPQSACADNFTLTKASQTINALGQPCSSEFSQESICLDRGTGFLLFSDIGIYNNVAVSLLIENLTEYYAANSQNNGVDGDFGRINIRNNAAVRFRFSFVDSTLSEVNISELTFTFFDIENGGCNCDINSCAVCPECISADKAREFIRVNTTSLQSFFLDANSLLCTSGTPDILELSSSTEGFFGDNPTDINSLTNFQERVSAGLLFHDFSSFEVELEVQGGLNGRNVLFGFSNTFLNCSSTSNASIPTNSPTTGLLISPTSSPTAVSSGCNDLLISLENREVEKNNLGGYCGNSGLCGENEDKNILIKNAFLFQNKNISIRIENTTAYAPVNSARNGILNDLFQLNLKRDTNVTLKFSFLEENLQLIQLTSVSLTVFDIDNGGCTCESDGCGSCDDCSSSNNAREVVSVNSSAPARLVIPSPNRLCISSDQDKTSFMSTVEGFGSDNPSSALTLTEAQKQVSVGIVFENISAFSVTLQVMGGTNGRNFFFAFESNLETCETNQPTVNPTLAPTLGPSRAPSMGPSETPTQNPTTFPSVSPTEAPTIKPSLAPTNKPTVLPTENPSYAPSFEPTEIPTVSPSRSPTTSEQGCEYLETNLTSASITRNNLGGLCGNGGTYGQNCGSTVEEGIYLSNVATLGSEPISIELNNQSEYQAFNNARNGIENDLVQLNLLASSSLSLRVSFRDSNGDLVVIPRLLVSVFDLDNGGCSCENSQCPQCFGCSDPSYAREIVAVPTNDFDQYLLESNHQLCVDSNSSLTTFSSTREGFAADNPQSAFSLSTDQKRISVGLTYNRVFS
eukprot:augustus_masked-scaffold_106-processed-gene-0.17-mRNA-1 protein AED:0.53 eAED:0.57 QI:0/0/0/1/1/1/2/0/1352